MAFDKQVTQNTGAESGNKPAKETTESLDNAEKARQSREETAGKPDEEIKKEEKKDAEQWRNEG